MPEQVYKKFSAYAFVQELDTKQQAQAADLPHAIAIDGFNDGANLREQSASHFVRSRNETFVSDDLDGCPGSDARQRITAEGRGMQHRIAIKRTIGRFRAD